jgi:hypothetical protein
VATLKSNRENVMRNLMLRLLTFTLLSALALAAPGARGQTPTGAGITPILVDASATCEQVAIQCRILLPAVTIEATPPKGGNATFTTSANGTTYSVTVTATSSTLAYTDNTDGPFPNSNQQRDTPGLEAVIVRGGSNALLYCRPNVVRDTNLTSPSNQIGQTKFCWGAGACRVPQTGVDTACNAFNSPTKTTDILQGILDPPASQIGNLQSLPTNLCGCGARKVRACDPSLQPSSGEFAVNDVGVCNPPSAGGDLTALQAESTVKTGANSCIIKQIGGTYYRSCF